MRRLGLILTLLLLLALAAAWAFGNGGCLVLDHPRGWLTLGTNHGHLAAESMWSRAPVLRAPWKLATTHTDADPTGITDDGDGNRIYTLRLRIWPVILAVTIFLAWRVRAHIRHRTGFPILTKPPSDAKR